ncbi:hypothetical protein ACLOJK_017026 [Asimina triloba]
MSMPPGISKCLWEMTIHSYNFDADRLVQLAERLASTTERELWKIRPRYDDDWLCRDIPCMSHVERSCINQSRPPISEVNTFVGIIQTPFHPAKGGPNRLDYK